ncbi:MAG TPA: GNAT family N-acetyltransferase [Acetobacteraceae bacterium]|jgi:GNAT superfamily N-acetyltransferase|nr:GNAT family N-acetyltransferase [Acetobacteraceae bacterium]
MPDSIQSVSYNEAPDALRREMALLQRRANSNIWRTPDETVPPLHDAALDALSFYFCVDGKMVSYAGLVRKTLRHAGQMFKIAGLSGVATDRDYQRRGFGMRTVAAATRWIEQSDTDFGIFTCDPPLADFYIRAGAWPVVPDVVLVGSRDEGALCSVALQKVVLLRLFSAKARAAASKLSYATIDLDLPVGQFL